MEGQLCGVLLRKGTVEENWGDLYVLCSGSGQ